MDELAQDLRSVSSELGLPGYALAVAKAGRIAFADAHGAGGADHSADLDAQFGLSSMAEPLLTAALLTFYDEGRFELDDPVAAILGEAWSASNLRVAASDGVLRGKEGESPQEQVLCAEDAGFLYSTAMGAHVEVDLQGDCHCRRPCNGVSQMLSIAALPMMPDYVTLKSHTGKYLDLDKDGFVTASSDTPVAWLTRVRPGTKSETITPCSSQSSICSGSMSSLVAGDQLRLKHQASGLWIRVESDPSSEDYRSLVTSKDYAESSAFVLEKQTFKIAEFEAPLQEVTIRHVLTKTSGFECGLQGAKAVTAMDVVALELLERARAGEFSTLAQWAEAIAKSPLGFQPGARCGLKMNLDIVGRIVEVLGRAPLAAVLRERIFEPLGMSSTGIFTDDDSATRRPMQDSQADDVAPVPTSGYAPLMFGAIRGAGGFLGCLASTVCDFMKFAHMLLGKGQSDGVRVLASATVELMTEANDLGEVLGNPEAAVSAHSGRGVCLLGGLELDSAGCGIDDATHSPGSYGILGCASTVFRVDPVSGLVVVLMTKHLGAEGRLERLVLRHVGASVREGALRAKAGGALGRLRALLDGRGPGLDAGAAAKVDLGPTAVAVTASALLSVLVVGMAARRCVQPGAVAGR